MRHLLIASALVIVSSSAYAGPIGMYTFTGIASGSLDGFAFADARLTISGTGDPSTMTDPGFPFRELDFSPGNATFTLGGVRSGVFSTLTYVVDNFGTGALAFGGLFGGPTAENLVLLLDADLALPVFSTYFLDRPLGPIGPAPNRVVEWFGQMPEVMPTSAGQLTIANFQDITFTAVVVPEPSTLICALTGLLFAVGTRRFWHVIR